MATTSSHHRPLRLWDAARAWENNSHSKLPFPVCQGFLIWQATTHSSGVPDRMGLFISILWSQEVLQSGSKREGLLFKHPLSPHQLCWVLTSLKRLRDPVGSSMRQALPGIRWAALWGVRSTAHEQSGTSCCSPHPLWVKFLPCRPLLVLFPLPGVSFPMSPYPRHPWEPYTFLNAISLCAFSMMFSSFPIFLVEVWLSPVLLPASLPLM